MAGPPGSWLHLARRFFGVIRAEDLNRTERIAVEAWLPEDHLREAFFAQSPADRRHGYEAALVVIAAQRHRQDLVRAALLHDIGKRHSGLGPLGRSIASAMAKLGITLPVRYRLYLDHGVLGAAEMKDAGAIAVAFARCHHGVRPPEITEEDWDLLQRADR